MSLLSLMKVTKAPLRVYIFTLTYKGEGYDVQPFREQTAAYLDAYLKSRHPLSEVRLYDLGSAFKESVPDANMGTRFTPCCMLRLFADKVADLPDRILYLDYDVVVRKDFSDFYRQDMEGVELAGALDYYGRWFYSRPIWKHNYMNSGVLLMNMDEIRRTGLLVRCRALCRKKRMFLPDQHALNWLCTRRRLWSRDYNEQRRLRPSTVIQHFSTTFRLFPWLHTVSVKPWQTEAMHKVLGIHEYDDLITELELIKNEMSNN